MRIPVLIAASIGLTVLAPGHSQAQTPPAGGRATVRAFRVEGEIEVDGRLVESHYAATRSFDELIQAVPESGGVPSQRTEVWLGFDDTNLYVGAASGIPRVRPVGSQTRCAATRSSSGPTIPSESTSTPTTTAGTRSASS